MNGQRCKTLEEKGAGGGKREAGTIINVETWRPWLERGVHALRKGKRTRIGDFNLSIIFRSA